MAIRKGFKKYEYEDIRTEYYNLTDPATADFKAGTIVKVASGAVAEGDAEPEQNTINKSVFLLAEDVKKDDLGFVYYIVEDVNNLEDRV